PGVAERRVDVDVVRKELEKGGEKNVRVHVVGPGGVCGDVVGGLEGCDGNLNMILRNATETYTLHTTSQRDSDLILDEEDPFDIIDAFYGEEEEEEERKAVVVQVERVKVWGRVYVAGAWVVGVEVL
ncbi:hypothetical protein HK104_003294, partial [Borealophlyctis nickersoniae]